MARIAFRSIVAALVLASLFVVATVALSRLRQQQTTVTPTQPPLDSIALPLDATGAGTQVIDRFTFSVKLDPYPPRADAQSALTLVAVDRQTQSLAIVTPTLTVAEPVQVDGVDYPMPRQSNGAYVASGRLFPQPDQWRLRVHIDLGEADDYSMVMLVEAQ